MLGEYNKSASSPFLMLNETMQDHAYTTHTYKHTTIGFLDRHQGHAQPVSPTARRSSTAGTAPRTARSSSPATSITRSVVKLVEASYGDWKAGSRTR